MLIGVDEVGRGSWAGPLLVIAATAHSDMPAGLADSKLLSRSQRQNLIEDIRSSCQLGEGWVQPEEIDAHGLATAMRLGVSRALIMVGASHEDVVIMDGKVNYCPDEFINVQCIVDADALHPIVSAASIYAKVLRDQHMARLAQLYPKYGFEKHVGYGTQFHQLMLKVYGPSKIHRKSYAPVRRMIEVA